MSRPTDETELVSPVALCLPNGDLDRRAVGWTRTPLHDTSGIGGRSSWGRNKRWEYWAVTTPTHVIAATVSSLDYAAVHSIMVHDQRTGETIEHGAVVPFGRGVELPATFASGPAHARASGLRIDIEETAEGTLLSGKTAAVSFEILAALPQGHERLGLVVPWSRRRFQYTVKDVARPATGTLTVNGETFTMPPGESWAVLDHGRGRWPYRVHWNWGAASGIVGDRTVGLQLGGRWTDGTGITENATVLDGRLHKISEELDWDYDDHDWLRPWRIRGTDVDLTLMPFWDHVSSSQLGIVSSTGHQCFGHFSGSVPTVAGRLEVSGLLGWAEDVRNRW
jgi:hypothetical protein